MSKKALLMLLFAIVGGIAMLIRKAQAENRLRDIDNGHCCSACMSPQVELQGDRVSCSQCGHVASLATLRAAAPTSDEIARLNDPRSR